ncbi:MAG: aldehyde ferredoxin oxidoreductase [Chloroflexi bacterium]|nr:aldehyde ferredoxin oxidoreductase [Chloroflexota bacterium]
MQILRANVAVLGISRQDIPNEYHGWGGRGLVARVLLNEVPPTCSPLSPANKLVLANGPFAGIRISSAGRLSAGAKSPLTGGIKEANAGGTAADALARLGLRAIVVEGQPADGALYVLRVGEDGAELIRGDEYRLLGTFDLCERLHTRFGPKVAIVCIGPAGEMKLAAAGVAVTDIDGNPNRYAARGGIGAVMGAKGIKAVVVGDCRKEPTIHDKAAFRETLKRFRQALMENHSTSVGMPKYGTVEILDRVQKLGGLPTRNFRQGSFELADEVNAEKLRSLILARGGEGNTTHACMPGCFVRCSNVFPVEAGQAFVSPLEYENIVLLGVNLGIGSLDKIAVLNRLCNDYGLDTIETGAAIGVAMEAGELAFGDADGAIRLLREMGEGTTRGRVLGQGAAVTGKVLGVERVPVVKGQAIAAYDPRAIKGIGVTYVTSPMGADHTAGHTVYTKVDHHLPQGQIEVSRNAQIFSAAFDALGLCSFLRPALVTQPGIVADLHNAVHGTAYGPGHISDLGREVIRMEKAFNKAAGFTTAHDRYPDFILKEKLPPFDLIFDVPTGETDNLSEFLGSY